MISKIASFHSTVFLVLGVLASICVQGLCQDDSKGNETGSVALSTEHTGRSYGNPMLNPDALSAYEDDSSLNTTKSAAYSTEHTGKTYVPGTNSPNSNEGKSSGYQGSNSNNANNKGGNSPQYVPDDEETSPFSGSGNMNGQQSPSKSDVIDAPDDFNGPNKLGSKNIVAGHNTLSSANRESYKLWVQGMNEGSITCPVGTTLNLEANVPSGGVGNLLDLSVSSRYALIAQYRFYPGYNALIYTPSRADRHIVLFIIDNQSSNMLIVDTIDPQNGNNGYAMSSGMVTRSSSRDFESDRETSLFPQHLPGGKAAVTYSDPELIDDYLK